MTENTTQAAECLSHLTAELDPCDNKAHIMRVMTSSDDMTWATPKKWFDYLNLEFGFTLDPCCLPETAKCKKFYTPKDDGLAQSFNSRSSSLILFLSACMPNAISSSSHLSQRPVAKPCP